MTHEHIERQFQSRLDGRLDEAETRRFDEHLSGCAECQAAFEQYQQVCALQAEIAAEQYRAGAGFSVEIMEALKGYPPHGERRLSMVNEVQNALATLARYARGPVLATFLIGFVALFSVRFMGSNVSRQFSNISMSIGDDGGSYQSPSWTRSAERYDRWGVSDAYELESQLKRSGSMTTYPAPAAPSTGRERYGQYAENERFLVRTQPVSTFSIDVDTGSYTNMRRYLEAGNFPPVDSVRIEEFINYFHYDYPYSGNEPFSLHYEIKPNPLDPSRALLLLGLRTKPVEPDLSRGWNLVFLIDTSGSMDSDDKLGLVKRSLQVLVEKMQSKDRIAIVTYAGSAGVVLDSTSGGEKERIRRAIDSLSAGGSTNGAAGIDLAYEVARRNQIEGGVNRVILATDGDFNVGNYSFSGLTELIEKKRASGITLTAIGVGSGNLNEEMLEQVANRGNGEYFYLDSFQEARRVFDTGLLSTIETVAKDVKVQIEFNPDHVTEYRLIGYDNRRLRQQDFNNDQVDAGEVGSGHTVTVLYEVVLTESELAAKIRGEFRYQEGAKELQPRRNEELSAELAFVKVRYKAPAGFMSKLLSFPILADAVRQGDSRGSDDFRFAAAVSGFAHLLRGSGFKGNYGFREVAELARGAIGGDERGERREFLKLVENAASARGAERRY